MRDSFFAGKFYPEKKEELLELLKSLFSKTKKINKKIIAGISPHAGIIYSGRASAELYSNLKFKKNLTFVIIGPNHTGAGKKISASQEDWKTPLGVIKNNSEIIKKLNLPVDESAHKFEHSIEVQFPFLQYKLKEIQAVEICVSSLSFEECRELAEKLSELKNIFLIASSDLTHYGADFDFIPFEKNIKENLELLDKKAISFIEKLSAENFYNFAKDSTTICGFIPITIAIIYAQIKKAKKAEVLLNYSSGDVTGDYNHCVDYASIIFV